MNKHQELIDKCRIGDRKAQFQLYQLYANAMLNTSFRILNNREEAEDVLQESFLKAFQKLHLYRNDSTFGAWLKRIVVNTSITALKKQKITFVELNNVNHVNGHHTLNPDHEDTSEWTVESVKAAMNQLPPGYRVVFSLYLMEGYDHQEIAEILGVSVSTSLSQYNRARKKIRNILQTMKKDGQIRAIYPR